MKKVYTKEEYKEMLEIIELRKHIESKNLSNKDLSYFLAQMVYFFTDKIREKRSLEEKKQIIDDYIKIKLEK